MLLSACKEHYVFFLWEGTPVKIEESHFNGNLIWSWNEGHLMCLIDAVALKYDEKQNLKFTLEFSNGT